MRTASPFHEGDEMLTGLGYLALLGCIAFLVAQVRLLANGMDAVEGAFVLMVALFSLGLGALWLGRSKPVVIPAYTF